MAGIARIVALGASNLTRGFQTVVSTARATWGPEVQVLAALGFGRSYGATSRVFVRSLPGILECGLWQALESMQQVPTRAIVTDVGNDIMYGFSAEQILEWVGEVLVRLGRITRDIILTDLPLENIRRLSRAEYFLFRSILFPFCRMTLEQVLKTAGRVNAGIEELSAPHGTKLFRLNPAWYGADPVHIRSLFWRPAWQEILDADSSEVGSGRAWLEWLRLYFMAPERRWLFGIEQVTPQSGTALPSGGRIWLY